MFLTDQANNAEYSHITIYYNLFAEITCHA